MPLAPSSNSMPIPPTAIYSISMPPAPHLLPRCRVSVIRLPTPAVGMIQRLDCFILGPGYFDAGLGRFIGRDPLGYVDGMSLYRGYFASGLVDPSGSSTHIGYVYVFQDGRRAYVGSTINLSNRDFKSHHAIKGYIDGRNANLTVYNVYANDASNPGRALQSAESQIYQQMGGTQDVNNSTLNGQRNLNRQIPMGAEKAVDAKSKYGVKIGRKGFTFQNKKGGLSIVSAMEEFRKGRPISSRRIFQIVKNLGIGAVALYTTFGYDVYQAEAAEIGVKLATFTGLCAQLKRLDNADSLPDVTSFTLHTSVGTYDIRLVEFKGKCYWEASYTEKYRAWHHLWWTVHKRTVFVIKYPEVLKKNTFRQRAGEIAGCPAESRNPKNCCKKK